MPALSIRGACPHWAIRGACPHWAIRGACPHWAVRGVRCATLRSALIPNIRNSRSLLIDRRAGVLFPTALAQSAGYKAFLRVQSERSERLRELPSAGTHRGSRSHFLQIRSIHCLFQLIQCHAIFFGNIPCIAYSLRRSNINLIIPLSFADTCDERCSL